MEIDGKVAVVTGAGSGIGRASAAALAAAGASIAVADIDERGADETVRHITGNGGRAVAILTDVRDVRSVEHLFAETAQRFGGVDIVHNNAGIVSGDPPWPHTPVERALDVVVINLGGVVIGTRVACDYLRSRGGGAIVNTASIAARVPFPDDAVYAATKAGVAWFTESCAALRERENIRVNAVLPGMVDTPIINKTGDGTQPAQWLSNVMQLAPMIKPEEIAGTVLELVRDDRLAGECRMVLGGDT